VEEDFDVQVLPGTISPHVRFASHPSARRKTAA
jgi:hypothetical protein